MDKRYWNRGGEVVEPKRPELADRDKYGYLASLPAIGSIDPSYPVGWVGDDVEMVWQVRIRKSMEWFNTEKEIYDKWLTDGAKEDLRRILFLPVNKVTIKSESHAGEKKPFIVANVREILDYWNNGEGCTFSRMVEMFNEVAARQQSAAEIDRLRGEVERLTIDNMAHEFNQAEAEKFAPEYKRQIREDEANKWKEQVRKLREGLEEMISTIERNAVDNRATIVNVKLWAKSWREELLTETEG